MTDIDTVNTTLDGPIRDDHEDIDLSDNATTSSSEVTPDSSTPALKPATAEDEHHDYLVRTYHKVRTGVPLAMLIHGIIAVTVCVVCFFIWHWVSTPDVNGSVWWWLIPIFVFITSIFSHQYFFLDKKYFEGVVGVIIIVNVAVVLSWQLLFNSHHPWFLYINFASAMGSTVAYYMIYKREQPAMVLLMCEHLFWQINLLLFLVWANTGHKHPWFIYPLFVMVLPIGLARFYIIAKDRRKWVYSGLAGLWVCLLTFFVWGFTGSNWPWFVFVWFVVAIVCGALFWVYRHEEAPVATVADDVPIDRQALVTDDEIKQSEDETLELATPLYPTIAPTN